MGSNGFEFLVGPLLANDHERTSSHTNLKISKHRQSYSIYRKATAAMA